MAPRPLHPKNTSDGHTLGQDASDKISFFGADAIVQGDITGARDDGTALAALLTYLESIGLITDSTTAS